MAGILMIAAGLLLHFKVEIPWLTSWIGKLPGDIVIKRDNAVIYFPLTTSLFVSVVLSILLSVFFKSSR